LLLAIDVGNTNIVIGLFDSEKLKKSWRIQTDPKATADELNLTFKNLLSDQPAINEIALCATVPAVLGELRKMLSKNFSNIKTVIIEPGIKTGVPVLIDNPKEVGADRIANSLAVFTRHGGPSVVVDFGTSTNFDVVSAQGEFLGGALAPGIEISLDALVTRAAQLRKVELTKPRSVIGKGTVEALQSGALYGFAGQVDGIVNRIKKELGELTAVVATGGLASLVVSESETITHHEPDLTLEGLRLVFEKNR
jgi:type III pantothenate kinase